MRRYHLLGLLLLALCCAGCPRRGTPQTQLPVETTADAAAPPLSSQDSSWLDNYSRASEGVAGAMAPAVAFVLNQRESDDGGGLFGGPRRGGLAEGSAVVIDPEGYLLTNAHVVRQSSSLRVLLPDGESYPARLAGADPVSDLAVLRISPKGRLPAATLGDATSLRPGAWVMACGYPFGGELESARFSPSFTIGTVSATGREFQSDVSGQVERGLIQTDAAINPGNSGGPLVDGHARVIGINQAILTTSEAGGNVGVGFAIPMDARTKRIISLLKQGRPVVRGQLGVMVVRLTPELSQQAGTDRGALVVRAQSNGPAARGGIQAGDVITQFNGKAVNSADELTDLVRDTAPGTTVTVQVTRKGRAVTVRVKVGKLG